MHILMTGGTGFIGHRLAPMLIAKGYQVTLWTQQLKPKLPQGVTQWVHRLEELPEVSYDAVINLAGAGIADQRWSPERKALLVSSRVETTRRLVEWIKRQDIPPRVLISASAVGYYGEQGEQLITEDTPPVDGFTHQLCAQWEAAAQQAASTSTRVCLVRTGVVLGQGGGSMKKMLPAFRFGLGGPLGSGQHWFPWIHLEDMARIYLWLLEQPQAQGVYNAAAPVPVRNVDFTRALGKALKRPAWIPMPEKVLHLLFGEMAELLLVSAKMQPQRLQKEGFDFRYPQLPEALQEICD
ncbi:TIGR01777 family oxidoreductase [Marinospirillum sp. MEB164]|uniref:TIGR01777 family oxidoreductase n=1 Tax=Marinospirillum alkalitolerans TaxID=3123374 RepID=A0ABW8Q1S3_9GAMM